MYAAQKTEEAEGRVKSGNVVNSVCAYVFSDPRSTAFICG